MTTATDALFHLSLKIGQRSAGRSAVAAAAYRAAERLTDERQGRTFDYSRKGHVIASLILAPTGAPAWARHRATLWNRVEAAERRRDAQIWREVEVSIPRDIPRDRWETFAASACRPYVAAGSCVDLAIHCPPAGDGQEQPHVHIMITPRAIDGERFAARKNELLAALLGSRPGDRQAVVAERARWAGLMNEELRSARSLRRADPRSLRERGIDREPEPLIGEARVATYRRLVRHGGKSRSRRLAHVVHARALRAAEEELLETEVEMSKVEAPRVGQVNQKVDVKRRLIRERVPDIDLDSVGAAVHMVRANPGKPLRVMMADGSWAEYDADRRILRTWGGPDEAPQAAEIAKAIAKADGIDDVRRERPSMAAQGPNDRRRFGPREIESLAERWRQRGFSDVFESPGKVWITLSPATRLEDRGNQILLHGRVDDEAVRAMVLKASEDWGASMVVFGPEDFKRQAWLEAQRQGVEVSGYSPPPSVVKAWEKEQAQRPRITAERREVTEEVRSAQLLKEAAGGSAEAAAKLPPDLQAFLLGYLANEREERETIAAAKPEAIVPELARARSYGQAWLDPAAATENFRSWAAGKAAATPPACPHIAKIIQSQREQGADPAAAAVAAARALRIATDAGQQRTAEDLAEEVSRNLAIARGGQTMAGAAAYGR